MKQRFSSEKIQKELQVRVNNILEVIEDNAVVKVGMPYKHELDADGCNWSVSVLSNGFSYTNEFERILYQFRREVDLD